MKKLLIALLLVSRSAFASGWECIDHRITCLTWRMSVPTGWVVSGETYDEKTYAMTFVPDPNHDWKG